MFERQKYTKVVALLGGIMMTIFIISGCGTSKEGDCHTCPDWGQATPDKIEQPVQRS